MSSWIGVYPKTKSDLEWMRKNFKKADKMFKKIHPIFESRDGRFEHGIQDRRDLNSKRLRLRYRYYWEIPCHWDNKDHFKQTAKDIRLILKRLERPKGVTVHLSQG